MNYFRIQIKNQDPQGEKSTKKKTKKKTSSTRNMKKQSRKLTGKYTQNGRKAKILAQDFEGPGLK